MEYAEGGELFDYLVSRGRMKESDAVGKMALIIGYIAIFLCTVYDKT